MIEIPTQFTSSPEIEFIISDSLVPYEDAHAFMEARVEAIARGEASECVWLLEHPPLYTSGTSAKPQDFLGHMEFPVYATGRGGQYTYHGPGQRIAYVMLNLAARGGDVRAFVQQLEDWIIATLAHFNIKGEKRCDRIGVWVQRPDKPLLRTGEIAEDKIAAIGIRVRKGITFHGISLNIEPNLAHYAGIIPCGITHHGVTSFWDLGHCVTMEEMDAVLRTEFKKIFQ